MKDFLSGTHLFRSDVNLVQSPIGRSISELELPFQCSNVAKQEHVQFEFGPYHLKGILYQFNLHGCMISICAI